MEEHFYHRNGRNVSEIDKAISHYGIDNFKYQILELCDPAYLDQEEDYYIHLFMSNIDGYNIVAGGQHNIGESNSNCKMDANSLYQIREFYNNRLIPIVPTINISKKNNKKSVF